MNVTNDCYMYFTWIVTVFNVSLTFSGSDDLIRNLFPGDNFTIYISNRLGILQVVKNKNKNKNKNILFVQLYTVQS